MEYSQRREWSDATMPSELSSSNDDEKDASCNWKNFCFETELMTVESINKKNLQFLHNLSEMIHNMRTLQVPTANQNEFEQIAGYYRKQEQVMGKELEHIRKEQSDLNKEKKELVNKIKKKREELEKLTQQLDSFTCDKKSEMKTLKKQYQCVEFAKEFYMKKFGIAVITGLEDDSTVWCTVYFDERDDFGIKFLFSRPSYKILKVDATSVLTPTQQAHLEEKFGPAFDRVPALMCTLRYLVLNKT